MYLYTFTWFSFTYVRPHESNIIGRLMNRLVLPGGNVLLDRSQVHGLFDDRGVIIEACHISREECKMWSLRKVLKISAVSWQHWEGFSFDFVGGRRNEHLPPTNYPIRKHKTYPILCNRQAREMVLKDQCEWYERLAKRMLSHWRHTIYRRTALLTHRHRRDSKSLEGLCWRVPNRSTWWCWLCTFV